MNHSHADWGLDGLELGISLAGVDTSQDWEQMLHWVDFAEDLGLHSVWLPEGHFARGAVPTPLLLLAAFAARTRRLRLATTSLLLPIHDATRMAREVATLDHLSQGRVILGLGRGFRKSLFEAFGVDGAQKRNLFDESLDRMLDLWCSETDAEHGERRTRAGESCVSSQQPHPPLAVAAFGRKGLAQAARRGLPYLASPIEPFEVIAENLEFHADNLPDEARAEDIVVPIMRTVFVSRDVRTLARVTERLEREVARNAASKLPRSIARALEAPIESRIVVGPPECVSEQLARYRDELGMNLVVVRPHLAGVERSEQEASLRCIREEILPALQHRVPSG